MRIAIYDNSLYISKQLVYLLKKYEEIKKICFSINSFHGNEVILSNNPNTDIAFLCVCDSVKTEIIRKFCLENSESKIIIVANIPDYRYAFQFHAFDFIPLPIREQNIFHTLDDALPNWHLSLPKSIWFFYSFKGHIFSQHKKTQGRCFSATSPWVLT